MQNAFLGSATAAVAARRVRPLRHRRPARWKLTISFATAAARLQRTRQGLLPRRSRCSSAAYSPRILSAAMLGSRRQYAGQRPRTRRPPRPVKTRGRTSAFDAARALSNPSPTTADEPRAAHSARPARSPHPPGPHRPAASGATAGGATVRGTGRAAHLPHKLCDAAPLLIADIPWLLYRSFFALPKSIVGADGRPVNALLGTVNALLARDRGSARRARSSPASAPSRPPTAWSSTRPTTPTATRCRRSSPTQWAKAPELLASLGWTVCEQRELRPTT